MEPRNNSCSAYDEFSERYLPEIVDGSVTVFPIFFFFTKFSVCPLFCVLDNSPLT
jgi:hypothetical protein